MTSTSEITPAQPESNAPPESKDSTIEISDGKLDLKLPVRGWARTWLSLILVVGAALFMLSKSVVPFVTQRLEAIKSEKASAALPFQEYQKHFNEQPSSVQTLFDSPESGKLTVSYYPSDGCLLVKRTAPGSGQPTANWIPASRGQDQPAPGRVASMQESRPPASNTGHQPAIPQFQLTALTVGTEAAEPQGCTGKCWEPHPGPFQSWNGQQNGCWIQVWRKWPEGCQHYQWFNSCNGYWDSYPNGAPKVYWTCCMH
jgi:hypothetical protein